MKHYKDSQGNVYAYAADGSQDHLIKPEFTPIQASEVEPLVLAKQQADFDAQDYYHKRISNYPPIGDQLDAFWKGGAEAAAMKAKIDEVKAKYPKS